jgi:hypothetical protein
VVSRLLSYQRIGFQFDKRFVLVNDLWSSLVHRFPKSCEKMARHEQK